MNEGAKARAFHWYVEVLTAKEEKSRDPRYAFVIFLLKDIMPEWIKFQFIVLQQLNFLLCLKQNFAASVFFTLEEKVILTCLLLKWCSENRYEMDKTGNHWRWLLKSLSTTFIYPVCLWATVYMNNFFLCPIVRPCRNCCLYSSEMSITFERLHCLAVFFARSAKTCLPCFRKEARC